jgi:putative endonuclease
MKTQSYVYIITNKINTVLYTGVTGNLVKRIFEHREKHIEGFTKRYNITKLVYYEVTENIETAIEREKQIKNYSREKKREMITAFNIEWKDLWKDISK